MSEDQAKTLAQNVRAQLGSKGDEWCRNQDVLVEKKQNAIFEKAGSSTDSALAAVFVPVGYDEFTSSAQSAVLGQIIQPWFYNQLRTEEQLGYAVFAFSMNVGRQWGWASFCKAATNNLLTCGNVIRHSSRRRKQNCAP